MYRNDQYVWRPGFWSPYREGWVWTPASYLWTPHGYVYTPGFWDYPLAGRGLLFAPVAFSRPLWLTPGWVYQPSYFVTPSVLTSALFIGPAARGYYFGSYYGPAYRTLGYRPWFAAGTGGGLFAYYNWANRANPAWAAGVRATFDGRFNGTLARPPVTLRQQAGFAAAGYGAGRGVAAAGGLAVVRPLRQAPNQVRLSAAQVNLEHQRAVRYAAAGGAVSARGRVAGYGAAAGGVARYGAAGYHGAAAGGAVHYGTPGRGVTAAGGAYATAHHGAGAGGVVHSGIPGHGVTAAGGVHASRYGATAGGTVHASAPGHSVTAGGAVHYQRGRPAPAAHGSAGGHISAGASGHGGRHR
jgi:hypothetical protein